MDTQDQVRPVFLQQLAIVGSAEADRLAVGEYQEFDDEKVDIVEKGGESLNRVVDPYPEPAQQGRIFDDLLDSNLRVVPMDCPYPFIEGNGSHVMATAGTGG